MKAVIADDERMALVMLKKFTDWEGLGLTLAGEARDGEELLGIIKDTRPDIVVTDIKMPVYTGLEIIAKTLESGMKPYFLITSAYTDFEYTRQAMRLGVNDFLPKPIDRKELNEALGLIIKKAGKSRNNDTMVSSLVRNICKYIEEHYAEKLSLESISEQFYISPNYFSALFKKEMKVNFVEYLTEVRMREAEKLLSVSGYTIAEVAEMTGYRDASHFTANFAKKYGMTPSAWRKKPVEF